MTKDEEAARLKARERYWGLKPEDYPKEKRKCVWCEKEFEKWDIKGQAEHEMEHNPAAGQWTDAYRKIAEARQKGK